MEGAASVNTEEQEHVTIGVAEGTASINTEEVEPLNDDADESKGSTGFFGNIFGGPTKGTAEDDCEPRDVALEPDSRTVNTDTERNEHQDTEVRQRRRTLIQQQLRYYNMYQLIRKVRIVLRRSTQNRELKLQCLLLKSKSLSVSKMM